jgi:hypothetical protein
MQLRRSGQLNVMVLIGPFFSNRKFPGFVALIGWLVILTSASLFIG